MITWTIAQLERNLSDGGVTIIHWRATKEEGDNSASAYGTMHATPNAASENFIEYADLTQDIVLSWIYTEVDREATEAALTAKVELLNNPISSIGTPW
jgi:hypothetical protein